jgi:uncharacterized membrane protein YphA (DoxX/SURF4 family)
MSLLRNLYVINIARVSIAIVLLYAGGIKMLDFEKSIMAVGSYQIVNPDLARVFGTFLPVIEVMLGLAILFKILHPVTNYLAALLMLVFILIIVSVWVRGLSIDCGCFGGGGELPEEGKVLRYSIDIARDFLFMALALISSRTIKKDVVLNSNELNMGNLPDLPKDY